MLSLGAYRELRQRVCVSIAAEFCLWTLPLLFAYAFGRGQCYPQIRERYTKDNYVAIVTGHGCLLNLTPQL